MNFPRERRYAEGVFLKLPTIILVSNAAEKKYRVVGSIATNTKDGSTKLGKRSLKDLRMKYEVEQ